MHVRSGHLQIYSFSLRRVEGSPPVSLLWIWSFVVSLPLAIAGALIVMQL